MQSDQQNTTENIEESTGLSKKERREAERTEKQTAREKEIRMKKLKAKLPWVIFGLLVIGAIYGIAVLATKNNAERPGEAIEIQGREHISLGTQHPPYNSNPPTSGPHASDVPWGFKENEIADENAIHNLEHGGIWISYKNLDEASVNTLRDIAKQNRLSVIVSPREANDINVAVASWGRLMKLDSVDVEKITEFIRQNKNHSPEPLAR